MPIFNHRQYLGFTFNRNAHNSTRYIVFYIILCFRTDIKKNTHKPIAE